MSVDEGLLPKQAERSVGYPLSLYPKSGLSHIEEAV